VAVALAVSSSPVGYTAVVSAAKSPGAWLSPLITRELRAAVCGACGHTELYIEDPRELVEAARRRPEA